MRLAAASLLLAACASKTMGPPPPDTPPPVQAAIAVSDDPHDFKRGNTFVLVDTMAIYVRVQQPALPATSMLSLKLVDPHGELFFEDNSPYTTNSDPTVMMQGPMSQPLEAWKANPIPGGWEILRSIPIRGTNFTRIPQSDGAWGLTAQLDGVPGELSTTVMFTH
jgi:hypothetical protein